jgi:Secretion system C-terminal sorting domain
MKILTFSFFILIFTNAGAQSWVPASGEFSQRIVSMYHDTLSDLFLIGGQFGYLDGEHVGGFVTYDGNTFTNYGCAYDCDEPIVELCIGMLGAALYNDTIYMNGSIEEEYDTLVNQIPETRGLMKFKDGQFIPMQLPSYDENFVSDFEVIKVLEDTLYVLSNQFGMVAGYSGYGGAKYDGMNWMPFEVPNNCDFYHDILDMIKYDNQLYICGNFGPCPNEPADLARLNNNLWETVGNGIIGAGLAFVYCMEVYHDELYIGGTFNRNVGNAGEGIMKWNGVEWSDIGSGITEGEVDAMVVLNNELYVSGNFDEIGDVPAHNLARWDGHRWCAIPNEFTNTYQRTLAIYRDTLYTYGDTPECNGCLFKFVGEIDTCSIDFNSIAEQNFHNSVQLYPNPTSSELTISSSENNIIRATAFDPLGKQIQTIFTNARQIQFDTSNFAKGCYHIQIELDNGQIIIKKLIMD